MLNLLKITFVTVPLIYAAIPSNGDAMQRCQQKHSYGVCIQALG